MTLQATLDAMAAASKQKLPAEALDTMQNQIDDLAASGLAERSVGEGAEAPSFSLPGPGGPIALGDLVSKGPVVLTWFRGSW